MVGPFGSVWFKTRPNEDVQIVGAACGLGLSAHRAHATNEAAN